MNRWRSLNHCEVDICWKILVERMEEEVLDKYKAEESKRGSFKGRGNPWNGEEHEEVKKYRTRKW